MVLQNVTLADLVANKKGICNGGFTHVMKSAAGPNNARNYLDAAQRCGLKVIFNFPDTVNYSTGRVYPSRVAKWVKIVKNHPALFGYLTVKEPSWNHISGSEIRSLYAAFHKADPNHPVLALFGDIPHFNQTGNYWGTRMADILVVDWYPVETARNGCSRSGVDVQTTGAKHLKHVRAVVNSKTPGTPVWLMVQTHKEPRPLVPQEAASHRGPVAQADPRWLHVRQGRGHRLPYLRQRELRDGPAARPHDDRLDAHDRERGPRRHLPVGARTPQYPGTATVGPGAAWLGATDPGGTTVAGHVPNGRAFGKYFSIQALHLV